MLTWQFMFGTALVLGATYLYSLPGERSIFGTSAVPSQKTIPSPAQVPAPQKRISNRILLLFFSDVALSHFVQANAVPPRLLHARGRAIGSSLARVIPAEPKSSVAV